MGLIGLVCFLVIFQVVKVSSNEVFVVISHTPVEEIETVPSTNITGTSVNFVGWKSAWKWEWDEKVRNDMNVRLLNIRTH